MKLLRRILLRILNVDQLRKDLESAQVAECSRQVIMGANSKFYGSSVVNNLQNRRESIRIGDYTHIRGILVLFAAGGEIRIGDNCYVGEGTRIWSADSITIGNDVLISHNVNIIDTDSHELDHLERAESYRAMIRKGHSTEFGNMKRSKIVIQDHAWISYNVCILKGVTIGKGAIVAAGSVVTESVPDFTVVAGNPAKVIKEIGKKQE